MIVLDLSSSTFEFFGVLPLVSRTILTGFVDKSLLFLIISLGLSSITVPIPTRIASDSFLNLLTLSMSSLLESRIWLLSGSAIFPSADIAQFMTIFVSTLFH